MTKHEEEARERPLVMAAAVGVVAPDHIDVDDGGMAMVFELDAVEGEEVGLVLQLRSWDPTGEHADFKRFLGRRVEIMVRTIDR